jgi:hypothetical protein
VGKGWGKVGERWEKVGNGGEAVSTFFITDLKLLQQLFNRPRVFQSVAQQPQNRFNSCSADLMFFNIF